MRRRNLILLLGSTSAAALTVGSGAFSSTTVERGVDINVVPDGQSLVGYEVNEGIESDNEAALPELIVTADEPEQRTLATITNRFGDDNSIEIVDVSVTTQGNDSPDIENIEWDKSPFSSGETANICGTIDCSDAESGDTDIVELTVTVEGDDVTASLSGDTDMRRFQIRCEPSS